MQITKISIKYIITLIVFQSCLLQINYAQTKVLYKEQFGKKSLSKNWKKVNGDWTIKDDKISGKRNEEWAVFLCKKSLPANYILSFSVLADPKAYMFELMTNLNDDHFLGILLNQLENRVAIEDRAYFPKGKEQGSYQGSYIITKGHIGKLPKVEKKAEFNWIDWKVQKTGNQIFIWMNGEEMITYRDTTGMVEPKGKFGFAINGNAEFKSITLSKTRGEDSLPPRNFIGRPLIKPHFSFSE